MFFYSQCNVFTLVVYKTNLHLCEWDARSKVYLAESCQALKAGIWHNSQSVTSDVPKAKLKLARATQHFTTRGQY